MPSAKVQVESLDRVLGTDTLSLIDQALGRPYGRVTWSDVNAADLTQRAPEIGN